LLTYKDKKVRGPKALIDYFHDKVNYKTAFLIIFIALIIEWLLYVVILKTPNVADISLVLIYARVLVSWIILGILLYLFAYLIRSKKNMPKRALEKILSSLAALRMPLILLYVIFGVVGFIFLGNYIPVLRNIMENPLILESAAVFPNLTTVNIIGLIILFIISIFFLIYFLVLAYYLVKKIFDTKSFITTFLLLILLLVVLSLVNLIFGI